MEELLHEAKLAEADFRYKRGNRRLMWIAIIVGVPAVGLFSLSSGLWASSSGLEEKIPRMIGMAIAWFFWPGVIGLLFGIIPYARWSLKKRILRAFWVIAILQAILILFSTFFLYSSLPKFS